MVSDSAASPDLTQSRWPKVVAPLEHRSFRLLWVGQTVSGFGNSIRAVAMPFQLLALGASPLELGITIAINTVSSLVFLLVGGAVADRLPRRNVIVASDIAGGAIAAGVALLSAAGQLRVEHIYLAAAGLGAADAFLSPAYSAMIPELVPENILRAGNATRLLGRSVARIVGPGVGGAIVALSGPALAFGVDAMTFIFSFLTLLLVHPQLQAPGRAASVLREVREGLGHVLSVPWLWTTMLYFMVVNVAYAGQSGVVTPLLVRDRMGGDGGLYGLIISCYGVGTIVASIVVAQLAIRRPGRVMFAFEILAAVSVIAIGALPSAPAVMISMGLMGVGLSSSTVIWQSLLQHHVPGRLIGRVSSIDLLGNSVINPLGPLLAAALVASSLGPSGTFIVTGAYALALAVIGLLVSPIRRFIEIATPRHPPRAG